jgi:hypothetical protein
MITDRELDHLDLDLLHLKQLLKKTEGERGSQTIWVRGERGVGGHL